MLLVLVPSAILTGNSFMLFTRWQLIKKTKEGPAPGSQPSAHRLSLLAIATPSFVSLLTTFKGTQA